jgi:hypothetical protein
MRAVVVVESKVATDTGTRFGHGVVGVQIDLFV